MFWRSITQEIKMQCAVGYSNPLTLRLKLLLFYSSFKVHNTELMYMYRSSQVFLFYNSLSFLKRQIHLTKRRLFCMALQNCHNTTVRPSNCHSKRAHRSNFGYFSNDYRLVIMHFWHEGMWHIMLSSNRRHEIWL